HLNPIEKASAATINEWKTRTIYHLLTDRFAQTPGQEKPKLCTTNKENEVRHYCGGTFKGIISKLDYIKNLVTIHKAFARIKFSTVIFLGFDAILISPVDKQIEKKTIYGVGWHGYWAQDKFSINPHF
ncbi:6717_t:CDS:2, partial [Dentiscutata heterogama]